MQGEQIPLPVEPGNEGKHQDGHADAAAKITRQAMPALGLAADAVEDGLGMRQGFGAFGRADETPVGGFFPANGAKARPAMDADRAGLRLRVPEAFQRRTPCWGGTKAVVSVAGLGRVWG